MADFAGPVTVEKLWRVGLIRLTDPEKKNPLSVRTIRLISDGIAELESAGIERLVITGSGDTFAAGANIKEVAELDEKSAREFGGRGQRLMMRIRKMNIPSVAAIDGFCMGGAFDLAIACSKRIASARSVFAHPGPKLGIMTGWGGTQFLPRLVGEKKALEILLTARRYTAEDALEMGLIDAIEDDPLEKAIQV